MEKETDRIQGLTIGNLEEKDLDGLIPILRRWIQKDGRVLEEEFNAVLRRLIENTKGKEGNAYLVARDATGRAVGVMGFGEVHEAMVHYKSSSVRKAAGLLTAFVSPDDLGRGLGRELMKALFARARAMGWHEMIWSSNPRYRETAWAFYTKISGEPVGDVEGFFEEGTKSPVWRKSL
jgi:L-amino acid N-acyltransferase YncA